MSDPETSTGASVDKRRGRAEDRRMADRLTALEENVACLKGDVAMIRSNYATREDLAKLAGDVALIRSNYATREDIAKLAAQIAQSKADMLEVINSQTWKYVTWTTGAMALMTTAVFFIARNVH